MIDYEKVGKTLLGLLYATHRTPYSAEQKETMNGAIEALQVAISCVTIVRQCQPEGMDELIAELKKVADKCMAEDKKETQL